MLKEINKLRSQRGSLMVEALAMLGLISMVTPVVYKKAAERTNEMQDINAASQVRTVVNGIDAYLRDNYSVITSGGTVTSNSASESYKEVNYADFGFNDSSTETKTSAPINIEHFRDYLPIGFQNQGKIFKDLQVVIKETKDPEGTRKALTTILVAHPKDGGQGFTKIRTSRIASMIGTNGGYVDGDKATGVQGVWQIPTDEFPDEIKNNLKDGTIVATSLESVADGTGGGTNVLYRVAMPGREDLNMMETTLNMGGKNISNITNLIADTQNNTVNIKGNADTETTLNVTGDGVFSSSLKAARENFLAEEGYTQIKQKLYVGDSIEDSSAKFMVDGNTGSISALGGNLYAGYYNGNPYLRFGSNASPRLLKVDESQASFMEDKVTIDAAGNTDIVGDTSIDGTLAAVQSGGENKYAFTTDAEEAQFYDETLHVLKDARRVDIGNEGNPANLRVYGETILNDLTVEQDFKAGHVAGTSDYGLNVNGGTGNVLIKKDLEVNGSGTFNDLFFVRDQGGNDVLTVNSAANGKTYIKELAVGNSSANNYQGGTDRGTHISLSGQKTILAGGDEFTIGTTGGGIKIKAEDQKLSLGSGVRTDQDKNELVITSNQAQLNSALRIRTDDQGAGILAINNETDSSKFYQDKDGYTMSTSDYPIYIRKGAIEIMPNEGTGTSSDSERFGYIKADRFVSNNRFVGSGNNAQFPDGTASIDGNTVSNPYTYEVNPAYTSMMNDIKLSSRGGARLSDILPDFINKGIYVLDNTYEGNSDWETAQFKSDGVLQGLSDCSDVNCDTSPWLGFIPTPHCPPNYAAVATITPIRFNMAQAGIAIQGDGTFPGGSSPRVTIAQTNNPKNAELKISENGGTAVDSYLPFAYITDNSQDPKNSYSIAGSGMQSPTYWVNFVNHPYNFQINTWLNTTIKKYYQDSKFQGWHGIMGFIYPAQQYAEIQGKSQSDYKSDDIIWNLFPVRPQELSAIATIYCYFDREQYSTPMVDPYLPHNAAIGSIRYGHDAQNSKSVNYNDPTLNYDNQW